MIVSENDHFDSARMPGDRSAARHASGVRPPAESRNGLSRRTALDGSGLVVRVGTFSKTIARDTDGRIVAREEPDAEEMLSDAVDEGVVYLPGHLFSPDDRRCNCLRIPFSHVSFDEMERGIEALATTTREATSVDGTADVDG